MEAEQEPTTMEPILSHYASDFSDREFEIAQIMLEIPDIIISELDRRRPGIRSPWGHKKRRSALAAAQLKLDTNNNIINISSSCSPNLKIAASYNNNVVKVVERASPNTPLSFESEEKPSHHHSTTTRSSKVVVGKRKREDWLEMIDGLDKRKELLQKEIQNVKDYKDKLVSFNLVLQSRIQELKKQRLVEKQEPQISEPQLKCEEQSLNLDMHLVQPTLAPASIVICAPTILKQEYYHPQIIAPHQQYQMHIINHTAQTRSTVVTENYRYLSSTTHPVASTSLPSSNARVNAAGFRLVSCNNIADSTSLANQSHYKAMTAQRRHQRLQKCWDKKTSVSSLRQSQERPSLAKRGHEDDPR